MAKTTTNATTSSTSHFLITSRTTARTTRIPSLRQTRLPPLRARTLHQPLGSLYTSCSASLRSLPCDGRTLVSFDGADSDENSSKAKRLQHGFLYLKSSVLRISFCIAYLSSDQSSKVKQLHPVLLYLRPTRLLLHGALVSLSRAKTLSLFLLLAESDDDCVISTDGDARFGFRQRMSHRRAQFAMLLPSRVFARTDFVPCLDPPTRTTDRDSATIDAIFFSCHPFFVTYDTQPTFTDGLLPCYLPWTQRVPSLFQLNQPRIQRESLTQVRSVFEFSFRRPLLR